MPLGSAIRAMFGKHENRIAGLYRGLFMNLDDFAEKIGAWAPGASRILEVGCGEGAVTEILAQTFPDAQILAIDLSERAGRLYRGRNDGVEFVVTTVQQVAQEYRGQFDLIMLSDVLHHIPEDLRGEIIDAISAAMAPGARFVLKDWGKAATPIHWLCHAGDRWLTGDKVAHLKPVEASGLVLKRQPGFKTVAQGWIKPWRNNYALVFSAP